MIKVDKKLLKNKFKQVVLGTSVFAISMILSTGNSDAVLQANGNEPVGAKIDEWMYNVRMMESLGGAMGLTEEIDWNLTASTKSNNIDVHMQKNTEYGALAILSASSYGNPNVIEDGKTTTGNATGVVMNLNTEFVAAGVMGVVPDYVNAVARYKNLYNSGTVVGKKGDAMLETAGWHGSGDYSWFINDNKPLVRGISGSIFSYAGNKYWDDRIPWSCGSSYRRRIIKLISEQKRR